MSTVRPGKSRAVVGANRGSCTRALAAFDSTSRARLRFGVIDPMRPRRRPDRFHVTNAAPSSARRPVGGARGPPGRGKPTAFAPARRARPTSSARSSLESIASPPTAARSDREEAGQQLCVIGGHAFAFPPCPFQFGGFLKVPLHRSKLPFSIGKDYSDRLLSVLVFLAVPRAGGHDEEEDDPDGVQSAQDSGVLSREDEDGRASGRPRKDAGSP